MFSDKGYDTQQIREELGLESSRFLNSSQCTLLPHAVSFDCMLMPQWSQWSPPYCGLQMIFSALLFV